MSETDRQTADSKDTANATGLAEAATSRETAPAGAPLPDLPPAARRALAEAAERRRLAEAEAARTAPPPRELGGRKGPEPVRYGDWEKKGIAVDF